MSFSSTESFDINPLLDDDGDDDFEINPFWSSDEEEKEDEGNNENGCRKLGSDDFKTGNHDSGIVLSDTKDDFNGNGHKANNKTEVEKLAQNIGAFELQGTNNEHKLTRNFSEGTYKVENKLYTIKDKTTGKIFIEDDLSREYSRQKSESNVLPSLLNYWGKKKNELHKTMSLPNANKNYWLDALEKSKFVEDPWQKYDIIGSRPTERAKRFRYNALKKKWVQDEVLVKMENEPFGNGAMRKCFRMKKLSTIVHQNDWNYASNIVAKCYFDDEVLPKTYFDDIKLQMDAKLWAEEYNRHSPPKKVDIIQVSLLKMIDREGAPMYHIEHFVEGKYVKYNSNSGFVLKEDEAVRSTPQAFSHFTFERSGHQMIVVDIQGVGDLYTDPQIHTARADEYGDANLGTKGIALFFATHKCTQICQDLMLEKFDLSHKELLRLEDSSSKSSTTTEVKHNGDLNSPGERKMAPMFDLVERLISTSSDASLADQDLDEPISKPLSLSNSFSSSNNGGIVFGDHLSSGRQRLYSEADSGMGSEDEVNAHDRYFKQHTKKISCIDPDGFVCRMLSSDTVAQRLEALAYFEEKQTSILSQVHYDLATYNYIGRFTDNDPDFESCVYHLERSAMCGSLQANKILAYKYCQMSTEEFGELVLEENFDHSIDCFIEAATRGDKDSMIRTARAYDSGINLGTARSVSWKEALKWYEATLQQNEASAGSTFDAHPNYEINARMADMWRKGGNGVEKDPSYAGELYSLAAEQAMNCGKGKLSNKYYMIAEEAWAEVE